MVVIAMHKPTKSRLIRLSLILLVAGIALPAGGQTASANYLGNIYDSIEQFSSLPDEINQLKNNYNQALQELDRVKNDAERLLEQNGTLAAQNSNLADQNQQLTQMVHQLQEAEAVRKRGANKSKDDSDHRRGFGCRIFCHYSSPALRHAED